MATMERPGCRTKKRILREMSKIDWFDNGNVPPGEEDPGQKLSNGTPAKKESLSMRDIRALYPSTPEEADLAMFNLRKKNERDQQNRNS